MIKKNVLFAFISSVFYLFSCPLSRILKGYFNSESLKIRKWISLEFIKIIIHFCFNHLVCHFSGLLWLSGEIGVNIFNTRLFISIKLLCKFYQFFSFHLYLSLVNICVYFCCSFVIIRVYF